jgi:cellulose synthase (UDP-forming)
MAFLQSPQFFKDSTIAGEADFLGGRNSVFFQGIQHGRDGFDLAAFAGTVFFLDPFVFHSSATSLHLSSPCLVAGTNAIFRIPALHTVDGVPYGSLTEDAHTAVRLHKYGYKSVYVPDRLAVGIAPVTVANSMQQRGMLI